MIERLQLRDFQAYERLSVEFDPRITAIVGPSDVGKSSVLRALRWVVENRPLGVGFSRHGSDGAAARLSVDGKKVVRSRRGNANIYSLDDVKLEAFGTDVPDLVSDLLKVGDSSWQGQHESPFWFSLSPGEVAKELNRIVDLSEIDRVSAELASRLREARAEKKVIAGRLEESERDVAGLDWVDRLDSDLADLERKRMDVIAAGDLVGELRESVDRLDWLEKSAAVTVPDLSGLAVLRNRMLELKREVDELTESVEVVEDAMAVVAKAEKDFAEAESRFVSEVGDVCPICGSELNAGLFQEGA